VSEAYGDWLEVDLMEAVSYRNCTPTNLREVLRYAVLGAVDWKLERDLDICGYVRGDWAQDLRYIFEHRCSAVVRSYWLHRAEGTDSGGLQRDGAQRDTEARGAGE